MKHTVSFLLTMLLLLGTSAPAAAEMAAGCNQRKLKHP